MEIEWAVNSSDENPMYLDFWPVVKSAWLKIGIKPLLIIVAGDEPKWELENYTITLPLVRGIKPSFQAQIARIWAWKMLDGNLLMSDIDMMPLSRNYFYGTASKYSEDKIVSYCSDASDRFDGYHPMCYVLANSEVMRPLIIHNTWQEFVLDIAEKSGEGWSADQWHLTKMIGLHPGLVKLERGWNSGGGAYNRLDRNDWRYDANDVSSGKLYDSHLLRPYKQHKEEIDKLYNLIP
jgi:hypothetical protein